jgi:hypothetical protein
MAGRIYETAIRIGAKLSATFKSETYSASMALSRLGKEAQKLKSVEASTERFAHLTNEVNRLAAASALGEGKVKSVERALIKARQAAANEAVALHQAGIDTSKLASEQHRLATTLALTEQKMAAVGALSKLGGSAKRLAGEVKTLALWGAGGVTAAATAAFAVAHSTAEAGVDIEKTATRLGVTTEALQLLRSAGKKTGVDVEALDTGLGKLAINLGKVISLKAKGGGSGFVGNVGEIQMFGEGGGKGAGKAADPFKRLGLSAKELTKISPEKQLEQIADKINKLGTHAEKSAALVQIFGKGSLQMLPLIEKGSAGMEELFAAARASGNVLSEETIANSKKFHLALLATEGSIKGVKNTLGAALLPVVTDTLGKFTKFVQENRKQIKVWAEQIATWIQQKAIPALLKIGPEIWKLAEKVGGLIDKGAKLAGGFDNLGLAIGALRLAPLVKSIGDVGISAVKAAIGIGKYVAAKWSAVAATKALTAAEGAGGLGGGGGIGLGAGGATVGAAASVAVAPAAVASTLLAATAVHDKLLDLDLKKAASDRAAKIGPDLAAGRKRMVSHWYGGTSYEDVPASEQAAQAASYAKLAPKVRTSPSGGGKLELNFTPTINVKGGATVPDDVKTALDAATPGLLEKIKALLDAERVDKQRVSFG